MDNYTTRQGQMWDQIALEVYGDEKAAGWLMESNPALTGTWIFDSGAVLTTPARAAQTGASSLPPWRRA